MNLVEYAETELNKIIENVKKEGDKEDIEMQKAINKDILDIVKLFSKQGHSGFTANYSIEVLNRLLQYKPLSLLTGEEDEWEKIQNEKFLQNKRYSSVFKDIDTGKTYNIDGKIFSDDNGKIWYTTKDSKIDITFPYEVPNEPEKVYVKKED